MKQKVKVVVKNSQAMGQPKKSKPQYCNE